MKRVDIHHKLCEYLGFPSPQGSKTEFNQWLAFIIISCIHGFRKAISGDSVIYSTFKGSVSKINGTHNLNFLICSLVYVFVVLWYMIDFV